MIRSSILSCYTPIGIYINQKPQNGETVSNVGGKSLKSEESMSEIIVPDVVTIDDNTYNKLYPPNVLLPTNKIHTFQGDETLADYDRDLMDEAWIKAQPKSWKLKEEDFEKVIEYLETKCAETETVPTLNELESQAMIKKHIAEAIYDYWIDRRLTSKTKLMLATKKERQENRKKSNVDPYVVFRQNPDRVHTRKNRLRDNENYLMMLRLKTAFISDLKSYKAISLSEQERHKELKKKFLLFETRYQNGIFHDGLLESFNVESSDKPESPVHESVAEKAENKETFEFQGNAGCSYFVPVNNGIDFNCSKPRETLENFFKTPKGLMRRRYGRGGRIVNDRRLEKSNDMEIEFQEININPRVMCEKLSPFNFSSPSGSTYDFSLKNSTPDLTSDSTNNIDMLIED